MVQIDNFFFSEKFYFFLVIVLWKNRSFAFFLLSIKQYFRNL